MRIIFVSLYVCLFFVLFSSPVLANEKVLDIQEVKADNGLTAWLVEDHSLPIISIQFAFKNAGSIQNPADKQGLTQLLSNTLDEGAGELPSQEFQKQLSDNSISLYFSAGRDHFSGSLKTLTRKKETAFNLLELALTKPRFDAEPVERMRQANISRIQNSKSEPDWIGARIFNDKAFTNHPYARNSGGTLTTLKTLTADDLKQYHQTYLTQNNLVVAAAGDITARELETILETIFGKLPKTEVKADFENLTLQNQQKSFFYNQDIPQTMITVALPSFASDHPDYYALCVLNYIFGGGGFGSRLMEEVREKRGLTYGIYSSLQSMDYADLMRISVSTKTKSVEEVLTIIKEEMIKLQQQPVSKEELADAKSYLTGAMPLGLTSTEKISSTLLSLRLNERDINYLDAYKENINAVQVDDIQRVAKQILDLQRMMTVLVGNKNELNTESVIEVKDLPNVE